MPLPLTSVDFEEVFEDPSPWDVNYGGAFYRYFSIRDDDQNRYILTDTVIEVELFLEDGGTIFDTFTITLGSQVNPVTVGDFYVTKTLSEVQAWSPGQTFGYIRMYFTFDGDIDRTLFYKADAVFKDYPVGQVGG